MGLFIKGQVLARFVRHRLLTLTVPPSKETWRPCGNSLRLGKVTPVIDRTYPLREAPEAIRYLEVEHARAKVVITV